MQVDFINCFRGFHREALLSRAIISSFLTLILKSSNPLGLDDYRSICLVGCVYKAISKLLASRLKKVLGSIGSKCQSAFVTGRQLLDGVLVANEVVDLTKREGIGCLLFKVDFEKAYDKVSWNFLRYLLKRMGFGITWMKWMEALIFSSKMSVLVNGSPPEEFEVEKGLRQGDLLSPFLFVIVAEGLRRLVAKAVEMGDYVGFKMRRSCSMDILQFADVTLLFGEGSWKQVWTIKALLRGFELVSGLGINYHKSKLIGINIENHFLDCASLFLSCRRENSCFFLGIPIGIHPRRISSWNIILGKIKSRLLDWKARFLSFGGRLNLIKSVLSSLAIFMLSFYKAPKKILKEITKVQSNFLWGGGGDRKKIHWVSWRNSCFPTDRGGIGLRRIRDFNLALLQKWRWRILGGSEALWYEVLKARYGYINLQVVGGADFDHNKVVKSFW
ncbi:uncharacterized protein LOC131604096 [Vicia villosa]|uniref:uncharacterized protein LOC131604096 n=1 Tax=Vicia villosa TaxID=3911 RepID=UPI00273BCA37|nr:uncharacterized protein LOC131604096 [Vicia villosa]